MRPCSVSRAFCPSPVISTPFSGSFDGLNFAVDITVKIEATEFTPAIEFDAFDANEVAATQAVFDSVSNDTFFA